MAAGRGRLGGAAGMAGLALRGLAHTNAQRLCQEVSGWSFFFSREGGGGNCMVVLATHTIKV